MILEPWHCNRLSKTPLFRHLTPEDISLLFKQTPYQLRGYIKGSTIAHQHAKATDLLVLIEGRLHAAMIDQNERKITVEYLDAPRLIAPAFLFGKNASFPVDIETVSDSTILSISKPYLLQIFHKDNTVMVAFLNIISSRTQFLSERLLYHSTKTIEEKIGHYLAQLMKKGGGNPLVLPLSISQLSELFAVTRPALSRAFKLLAEKKIITREGRKITILKTGDLTKGD